MYSTARNATKLLFLCTNMQLWTPSLFLSHQSGAIFLSRQIILFSASMGLICSCMQYKLVARMTHKCYKQLVEKLFPCPAESQLRYLAGLEVL